MQKMTRFPKVLRAIVLSGSLLAALAFGAVAAGENAVGFTECDQGCGAVTGGNAASFQMISATPVGAGSFIADGPGEVGFTR